MFGQARVDHVHRSDRYQKKIDIAKQHLSVDVGEIIRIIEVQLIKHSPMSVMHEALYLCEYKSTEPVPQCHKFKCSQAMQADWLHIIPKTELKVSSMDPVAQHRYQLEIAESTINKSTLCTGLDEAISAGFSNITKTQI